ncbi:LysR family transcriptional regulator substrate-binding protein [Gordonia sp. NPDC003424]
MSSPADPDQPSATVFRLAYVPGTTPGKWVRIWGERHPDVRLELVAVEVADTAAAIGDGRVDMAITRLPDALTHSDPGPHHTITLYEETTVVVVGKDHVLTAGDELSPADLADENVLWPLDEPLAVADRPGIAVEHRPETTADAVELVAAGVGVLLVPQSLARLHHRRDLDYRPVTGIPTSTVGLLWPAPTSELAEEFIGIVRGRKATSSRGASDPAPKRSAKEKAAAKRASREAAGKVPGLGRAKSRKARRPR